MPTISQDRRTYIFQIRNDYAFSPPASGVVTAQSMKYTFERTLSHEMASPAHQFFTNIVGEIEFNNGQTSEITGIVAQGDTLTFQLLQPQGDFLTFLAMPFTCAVPIGLPRIEQFAPIPSAGPYYISAYAINDHLTAYQAAYGVDLAQLCLRPEITTDDATVLELALGTTTVDIPVRLSSEMDNAVTVNYATPPPPPVPPPAQPPPTSPGTRCLVPRVIGMTLRRAKSRIRVRHCSVGRVRYARSRRVGKIISQTPRPGTRKPRGFKVKLVVGRRR